MSMAGGHDHRGHQAGAPHGSVGAHTAALRPLAMFFTFLPLILILAMLARVATLWQTERPRSPSRTAASIGVKSATPDRGKLSFAPLERPSAAVESDDDGGGTVNSFVPTAAAHEPAFDRWPQFCQQMGSPTFVKPDDVTPDEASYLRAHVHVVIVTGSFDGYVRLDLALCTWIRHVSDARLWVVSDTIQHEAAQGQPAGSDTGAGHWRLSRGTWLKGTLPPRVTFNERQRSATGYTVHWMEAQFRFVQGLMHVGAELLLSNGTDRTRSWIAVLDDDTFLSIPALVRLLTEMDRRAAGGPLYVNDHGWGGGGHFFNGAAVRRFMSHGVQPCVHHNMGVKFYASDVALKKCLPGIGVRVVDDRRLSHCQANFLRGRMLSGHHVTAHVKREVVKPLSLAMLRIILYYRVMYHAAARPHQRGVTSAYDWLMRLGACAYGSSCKLWSCLEDHDRAAIQLFLNISRNGSYVPDLTRANVELRST